MLFSLVRSTHTKVYVDFLLVPLSNFAATVPVLLFRNYTLLVDELGGHISTPNYPLNYPPYQSIQWHFRRARAVGYVAFTIKVLALENCSDCSCDYIRVVGGSSM